MSHENKQRNVRVLAVSSGGGHWVELLRLLPAFDGSSVTFVSVNRTYAKEVSGYRFYKVFDVTRWNKIRWIQTALQIVWILMRERPDVVISTGALPGYMAVRLGKMLGAKTIWVDSIANVEELSHSGECIGKYADFWLTQWEHLAKVEGPEYRGSVL